MYRFFDQPLSKLPIFIVLLMAGLSGTAFGEIFARPPAGPDRLDARVAWQIQLPAGQTKSFRSYRLLEGRIYAIATDGTVVAVRADTGEFAWIRQLAEENAALCPPVVYRTQEMNAVAFVRLNDVVFLDPTSGAPLKVLQLSEPTLSPVAVAPGRVFVVQPNGRVAAYRLRDGYIFWRAAFEDQFTIPPVYAPAINAVVAVDEVGLVAGLRNEHRVERRVIFRQHLRSEPSGQLALDGDMLYLSTANQTLHAIDMGRDKDSEAGDIVWQYRLAKWPEGGPILTETAIYQATHQGGLHRIAKNQGEFMNWFDPQARQFLAEWPDGVVVLRTDGTLALIGKDPDRPLAIGSAGGFDDGLANTQNDAIFLTDPSGKIRCIRPAEAPSLQLASFMPAQQGELPPEPDEPTEIDRLRKAAQAKRDKIAGIVREPESDIEQAAVEPNGPDGEPDAQPDAQPDAEPAEAEPYDPLRSKRPVVR